MLDINKIRQERSNNILILGNHPQIIQSILDFDYLSGKDEPSIKAIVGNSRGYAKYFWGRQERLFPVYADIPEVPQKERVGYFLNLFSGRRALSSGQSVLSAFPGLSVGVFFAENVPERHALSLYRLAGKKDLTLIGPASVGLVVPGVLKLGPIGGITPEQIDEAGLTRTGRVACLSASGGMTNELINAVARHGKGLSFSLSFGGDRFPLLTVADAFLTAQNDPQTEEIVYYGELGGEDEYDLIRLREEKQLTKPVYAHIAGTVADLFPESPQFGHAKAKASREREKASVKRRSLAGAGLKVSGNFADLLKFLK